MTASNQKTHRSHLCRLLAMCPTPTQSRTFETIDDGRHQRQTRTRDALYNHRRSSEMTPSDQYIAVHEARQCETECCRRVTGTAAARTATPGPGFPANGWWLVRSTSLPHTAEANSKPAAPRLTWEFGRVFLRQHIIFQPHVSSHYR